jgi:hypothetical protein
VIRATHLLIHWPLGRKARARIGLTQIVSRHDAAKLLVGRTGRGDDDVDVSFMTRLVQQWDIGYGQRRFRGQSREPARDGVVHRRVHDGLECVARLRIAEDDRTERAAIDAAVRIHDTGAETGHHSRRTRAFRRERLVCQPIGIDRRNTTRRQPAQDVALSGSDAAGQRDADHGVRFSAAVTVLRRSKAIVSGPTPPGTGVTAPATATTPG